jgi:hypothetical protein
MQAVKISIEGEYWDSFLYNDRLYLFTAQGSIETYAWDRLIDSFSIRPELRPLLRHFTARGRAWYSTALQELLESPDAAQALHSLTDQVTATKFEISRENLINSRISVTNSPAHPHTDVEAFYSNLYLSSQSGVHVMQIRPKAPLRTRRSERIFDGPSFRVSASYGALALAAGEDGLFKAMSPGSGYWERHERARQVSDSSCIGCNWAAFDLIASSPGTGGYVAAFSRTSSTQQAQHEERQFLGVIQATELFDTSDGLMFGAGDKLLLASESHLLVDVWNPNRRRTDFGLDLDRSLTATYRLDEPRLLSGVLDGSPAVFGAVIELDETLLILGSDGSSQSFKEPINWRIFPRSERYLNHLHVTYEDRLIIYAFVHDYFLTESNRRSFAMRRPFISGYGSIRY